MLIPIPCKGNNNTCVAYAVVGSEYCIIHRKNPEFIPAASSDPSPNSLINVGDCPDCRGTGYVSVKENCDECNGTGFLSDEHECDECGHWHTCERDCDNCDGAGQFEEADICETCGGTGELDEDL